MEHQWNDIQRGEPKYWGEKSLSQFHCFHNKPHKYLGSNPSLRRQRLSHGMTLQTIPPPLQRESTFPSNAARFQRVLLSVWKVPSTTGITLSLYSVSQTSLDNRYLTTTCRPYCKVVFAPRYTRSEVHNDDEDAQYGLLLYVIMLYDKLLQSFRKNRLPLSSGCGQDVPPKRQQPPRRYKVT